MYPCSIIWPETLKAKQRKKSYIHLLGVEVLFHMRIVLFFSHILRKAPLRYHQNVEMMLDLNMLLDAHSLLHLLGLLLLDNLARDGKSKTT